jgi:hypothetical protein
MVPEHAPGRDGNRDEILLPVVKTETSSSSFQLVADGILVTRTNSAFRQRLFPAADGDEINPLCTRSIRGLGTWRRLRTERGAAEVAGTGTGRRQTSEVFEGRRIH